MQGQGRIPRLEQKAINLDFRVSKRVLLASLFTLRAGPHLHTLQPSLDLGQEQWFANVRTPWPLALWPPTYLPPVQLFLSAFFSFSFLARYSYDRSRDFNSSGFM